MPRGKEAISRLRDWDGEYRADSVGAVTFEQFRDAFTGRFYALLYGEEDGAAFASAGRRTALLDEASPPPARSRCGVRFPPGCRRLSTASSRTPIGARCTGSASRIRSPTSRSSAGATNSPKPESAEARQR